MEVAGAHHKGMGPRLRELVLRWEARWMAVGGPEWVESARQRGRRGRLLGE